MAPLVAAGSASIATALVMLRRCLVLLIVLVIFTNSKAQTPSTLPSEYALKAVFLYNFTRFVDWPGSTLGQPDSPIVIGVLGEDPFGTFLDETVRGEKVHDRPLVVRRFNKVEEIGCCHILFISNSETARASEILDSLRGKSILTVSDQEGFGQSEVMIRFATEKKKIRLKINVQAVKSAHILISSKLLRLAEVTPESEEEK